MRDPRCGTALFATVPGESSRVTLSDVVTPHHKTNLSMKMTAAAHEKVISAVGTKPIRYLCDQDRYVTLAVFIAEDGSVICPVLLHPQEKAVPTANKMAWDTVYSGYDTLHIAAGRKAFMTGYLFHQVFEHFAMHVRSVVDPDVDVVVLLDGCGSHYNPRTCLSMLSLSEYLSV